MSDRLPKPALFARDPAELIVRVGLVRVDVDRAGKPLLRFIKLAALLMDQSEVVMSRSVSGIQGCSFQIPFEILSRALRAQNISEHIAEQNQDQDKHQRRC